MSSLQLASALLNPSSSCCSYPKFSSSSSLETTMINDVPKLSRRVSLFVPKASTKNLVDQGILDNKFTEKASFEKNIIDTIEILHDDDLYNNNATTSEASIIHELLCAVLEAVADRIEMHHNIGEQRDNWNTLLLNSINMLTLTASTMAGVAVSTSTTGSATLLALKLSSSLLFSAATGMLLVMNKIQPSQLAEEQRNATRLFKNLHSEIQNTIALGNNNTISEEDVKGAMEKVLALDRAYPLPLLGKMIEKFPSKFEPARWWPNSQNKTRFKNDTLIKDYKNGWNRELETEMREVIEVMKRKDMEDYERLGNLVLKMNKALAISGPFLTGIAAIGSFFIGDNNSGSWGTIIPVVAGALATVVNAFEHGGQVGMVFEMYRNCGGFFKLLEETIETILEEKNLERRENGQVFEVKMALKLGRSLSELRELASKSASSRIEGTELDEFASKLF